MTETTTRREPLAEAAEGVRAILAADQHIGRYIAQVKISERRKTFGLSMKPGDAGVTVHLSVRDAARPDVVLKTLRGNSHRIGAMLLKARKNAPDTPSKELVNGSGFLWLGRSKRLRLVDGPAAPVVSVFDDGTPDILGRWLELDRAAVPQGERSLIDWYVNEGTRWLRGDPETEYLWRRISGTRAAPTVRVADIGRTRWGLYRPHRHEVSIAWQTFQLSVPLVRHVLTHELVHAVRPAGTPHGPEFWRRFERARPGARQEQRELTERGKTVWMGDVAR